MIKNSEASTRPPPLLLPSINKSLPFFSPPAFFLRRCPSVAPSSLAGEKHADLSGGWRTRRQWKGAMDDGLFVFPPPSFFPVRPPSLNSIFPPTPSILCAAVQAAQFNNELSLLPFLFPYWSAYSVTSPNSSSHSLGSIFMNGPLAWTLSSSSLFFLALRVIQPSSASYLLLSSALSPLSLFIFFSPPPHHWTILSGL